MAEIGDKPYGTGSVAGASYGIGVANSGAQYSFGQAYSTAFASVNDKADMTLLDLLKLHLGIDLGDDSQNEALNRALNFAGDAIETYLDRIIVKRPVVEYFAHHFGTVELHNMPVDTTAPITVTLDGVEQSDYRATVYRGQTAYLSRIGHVWDQPQDWRMFDQVEVTYTAGYDPIPSDLANAIVYTAAGLYSSEGTASIPSESGELKQVQLYDVGAVGYTTSGSTTTTTYSGRGIIPNTVADMLSSYRRMSA